MRKATFRLLFIFIMSGMLCPVGWNMLQAQKWEIGISGGLSTYIGDLAPDFSLDEKHPYFSLFVKKNLSQFFSLGLSASQAHISGDDNNYSYLAARNLKFETDIMELSTKLEFHFLPFAFGLNHQNFTPFVSTGLSVFKFEPYITYQGNKTKLPGLDTEGRVLSGDSKKTYSLLQLSIPVGGGLKFKINERLNTGVIVMFQFCMTDYLDDVSTVYYDKNLITDKYGPTAGYLSDPSAPPIGSPGKQRGRSDIKDWYIFSGIFLSYKIKNPDCFNF